MKIRMGLPFVALGFCGCFSVDNAGGYRPAPDAGRVPVGPTATSTVIAPTDPGPLPIFGAPGTLPIVTAPRSPAPITGGTLLITQDGTTAVAADPDRDRVSIVLLEKGTVLHTVALEQGDEPGRLVEDGAGRVHVALRRGGAVVSIDTASGNVLSRRSVCGAPRGIAYEASTDLLHVACAGGELVSLPAAGGDATRRLRLDVDLRDVIVQPNGGLAVSRFKTGDVIFVDAKGTVSSRTKLNSVMRVSDTGTIDPMEPAVAWRAIGVNDAVYILHQYGRSSIISLEPPSLDAGVGPIPIGDVGGSPYGAPPGGCGGLVQAALTEVKAGAPPRMGAPLAAPVLTVDAAFSSDAKYAVFAHAGALGTPTGVEGGAIVMHGLVSFMETAQRVPMRGGPDGGGVNPIVDGGSDTSCARPSASVSVDGQPIAVAFNPSTAAPAVASKTWFAVQTREPNTIVAFRDVAGTTPRPIALGGDTMYDTGHELFHRDAGGGIACASCHPEGGEDGRVWRFDTIGDRRTQAVHVGLEGTEPFHWDGDMKSFGMLVDEVMVHRMGAVAQGDDHKAALQHWLFQLRPPAPIMSASDPKAVAGKALFESASVGCSGCHSGPKLTSNQSVYVGTTEKKAVLQVPSLHGVGYRAPFLHTGCAVTLRDRFNPSCGGGDLHGNTSTLNETELGELVAYLQTL